MVSHFSFSSFFSNPQAFSICFCFIKLIVYNLKFLCSSLTFFSEKIFYHFKKNYHIQFLIFQLCLNLKTQLSLCIIIYVYKGQLKKRTKKFSCTTLQKELFYKLYFLCMKNVQKILSKNKKMLQRLVKVIKIFLKKTKTKSANLLSNDTEIILKKKMEKKLNMLPKDIEISLFVIVQLLLSKHFFSSDHWNIFQGLGKILSWSLC